MKHIGIAALLVCLVAGCCTTHAPHHAASDAQEMVGIVIDAEQVVRINGQRVEPADVALVLGESGHSKDTHVSVRASKNLPYSNVIHVLDQVKQAGFQNLTFETE